MLTYLRVFCVIVFRLLSMFVGWITALWFQHYDWSTCREAARNRPLVSARVVLHGTIS